MILHVPVLSFLDTKGIKNANVFYRAVVPRPSPNKTYRYLFSSIPKASNVSEKFKISYEILDGKFCEYQSKFIRGAFGATVEPADHVQPALLQNFATFASSDICGDFRVFWEHDTVKTAYLLIKSLLFLFLNQVHETPMLFTYVE